MSEHGLCLVSFNAHNSPIFPFSVVGVIFALGGVIFSLFVGFVVCFLVWESLCVKGFLEGFGCWGWVLFMMILFIVGLNFV